MIISSVNSLNRIVGLFGLKHDIYSENSPHFSWVRERKQIGHFF